MQILYSNQGTLAANEAMDNCVQNFTARCRGA